jgi:hypothetical protein
METHSNILDDIQETLDPAVFLRSDTAMPQLRQMLRKWVRRNVYNLLTYHGWNEPEKKFRLVMTGSLTTYQWSENSDFDVSLFVEYGKLPDLVRADLISLLIEHFDGVKVPGTTHVMQCYVVPPGVGQEDLYRAGLRSAYDLDTDEWIVPPEMGRAMDVKQRMPSLIAYCKIQEDKMRLLLKYDPPGAKEFWHQIHKRRMRDQKAGKGDFSESNVIMKWLLNGGLGPEISRITGERVG